MGSPWIRARMWVSCIGRQILHHWATREALNCLNSLSSLFILSYLIFAMFDELHRAGVCVCMYYISNLFIFHTSYNHPGGSDGKESILNVGDLCLIPGLGRSPGEGQGNPLQYSCSENPHWQRSLAGYSPWGRKELDKTEWLSTAHTHTHNHHNWRKFTQEITKPGKNIWYFSLYRSYSFFICKILLNWHHNVNNIVNSSFSHNESKYYAKSLNRLHGGYLRFFCTLSLFT